MSRRAAAALAAALLATATAVPGPVAAHSGDPNVVARVDAVTPDLDGVTVEVRSGVADQLLLVNASATTVEVLDTKNVPFLRIARDRVEANYASADWYLSNSPLGLAQAPTTKREDWRVVARTSSWGWFDHRLHATERPLTPELRNARSVVHLADWTVPLRQGTTTAEVRGHVEYRPVLGAVRSAVTEVPAGLTADVLDGRVPGLFVRWSGSATVTIRGSDNEPFARLGPDGAEVNAASPTYHEDQRLRGAVVDTPADPKAQPRWTRKDAAAQLTWLDRRLAYTPGVPDDATARKRGPVTLVTWAVPVDGAGAIRGTTAWHGTGDDKSGSPLDWAVPALVLAAAVAAVLVMRRRAPVRAT